MIDTDQLEPSNDQPSIKAVVKERSKNRVILYLLLGLIILLGLYFIYSSLLHKQQVPVVENKQITPPRVLQIDILNGCGTSGVGAKFTDYLRLNGFDVVETKNYKSFHVPQTLVVDRIGDLTAAQRVARALGVKEGNVIQQINPDYFVDVSVIIGKDFTQLNPYH